MIQPPPIPPIRYQTYQQHTVDVRGANFLSYYPHEVKHRKRTTHPQLKILEETFKRDTKPNANLRKQLSAELGMTPRAVQVWFQNRRAKVKLQAKKVQHSAENGGNSGAAQDRESSPAPESSTHTDALTPGSTTVSTPAEATTSDSSSTTNPSPATPGNVQLPSTLSDEVPAPAPTSHNSHQQDAEMTSLHQQVRRDTTSVHLGEGISRLARQRIGHGELSTSPSPISAEDISMVRRTSLPAAFTPPQYYPRLPSAFASLDNFSRRASLETSVALLASNPFAQVVYAHNSALMSNSLPIGPKRSPTTSSSFHAPHQPQPIIPQPVYAQPRPDLSHRASLPAQPGRVELDAFNRRQISFAAPHPPVSIRRQHTQPQQQQQQVQQATAISQRPVAPPSEGPLPETGYSFGTSSSRPRSGVEEESIEEAPVPYDYQAPRYGSMASIASFADSESSAFYSEAESAEFPPGWDPDVRRASCPAPIVDMFSGMAVGRGDGGSSRNSGAFENQQQQTKTSPLNHFADARDLWSSSSSSSSSLALALSEPKDGNNNGSSPGSQGSTAKDAYSPPAGNDDNGDIQFAGYTLAQASSSSASSLNLPLHHLSSRAIGPSDKILFNETSMNPPEEAYISASGHYSPPRVPSVSHDYSTDPRHNSRQSDYIELHDAMSSYRQPQHQQQQQHMYPFTDHHDANSNSPGPSSFMY